MYSRAEKIINNESNRKSELSKIQDTLQSNGFPTTICSNKLFSKTTQNRNYTTFVSIPYVQGVYEPIKRVLAQVGVEVTLKPYFTLSPVFRIPKDVICDEKKCGLVYEIPCRDCDAVYVGETGRSLSTRKKEHVKAVKEMNLQKSALCQHIATCDYFIAWNDTYNLKIEPHYRKHHIAKSFLINRRAKVVNVLNRNDRLVLPSIYSMLLTLECIHEKTCVNA